MNFDFEDENPVSPPKLRVEPGQWVVREACDLSLPGHTGGQQGLWQAWLGVSSLTSLSPGQCEWSRHLSAGRGAQEKLGADFCL